MADHNLTEEGLGTEQLVDGHLLKVHRDSVRLPDGTESIREWIDHPGAAAVLPLHDDGTVTLVRQYRYPVRRSFVEVPAGKIDHVGEAPVNVAARELEEETGLVAGKLTHLASLYPTVGYGNEVIHLYLATELMQREQKLDDGEILVLERLPFKDAVHMARIGRLEDMKTVSTLLLADAKLRDL